MALTTPAVDWGTAGNRSQRPVRAWVHVGPDLEGSAAGDFGEWDHALHWHAAAGAPLADGGRGNAEAARECVLAAGDFDGFVDSVHAGKLKTLLKLLQGGLQASLKWPMF